MDPDFFFTWLYAPLCNLIAMIVLAPILAWRLVVRRKKYENKWVKK